MDNIYIITLYDYYGCLLTDKQQNYFESYYFMNLSLQEIALENSVSRNAVHKTLTSIVDKLKYYEDKLNLYDNREKINKILENIKDERIKEEINELI